MLNIFHREAGLVIQPLLSWLGASLDGVIYDKEYSDHPGLLKIKCPSESRNSSAADLLNESSFYLQQNKMLRFYFKKSSFWLLYPNSDGYGTIAS